MIDQEIAWSHADLSRELVALGCLPPPPDGAPIDELYKWIVADFFMQFCKSAGDSASMRARAIDAANFILSNFPKEREDLRPHIERALGRPLSNEEVKAGKLSETVVSDGSAAGVNAANFGVVVPEYDLALAELSDLL